MYIRALIENKTEDDEFLVEHGLSIYVEHNGLKILVDSGETGAFVKNAEKMGLDLSQIDLFIASHDHYDHTGGLSAFLERNNRAKLYFSKYANKERVSKHLFIEEEIGTNKEIFDKYSDRIVYINDCTEISKDVFVITQFKRQFPTPKGNNHLYTRDNGKLILDSFDHEVAIVFKEEEGLTVITGCSHNGIENMLARVTEYFPKVHINRLIGGFHLMSFILPKYLGESKKNIKVIAKRLIEYDIDKVYTCHCTGERGFKILKESMGDRLEYLCTGYII